MNAPLPAVLGGTPVLAEALPMARPTVAVDDELSRTMRSILESGQLTNGAEVRAFEDEVAAFAGTGHAVAVANCTTGLLLLLRCLGRSGEVVLPSFTFIASGHVVRWNGLRPVFADIDRDTFTVDPGRVAEAVGEDTAAILAVHTFGTPCRMDALEKVAEARGLPLVVDAAHGFGGRYPDGTAVGSRGLAEVFSLSPTKPLTAGEGGLITTDDAALAEQLRIARNYGNPGDYDSVLLGLNGRLNEFAAAVGRAGLRRLPEWVARRNHLAATYRADLADLPGIRFQQLPEGASGVYKDFSIVVDGAAFGLTRDELVTALSAEGVPTRRYFDPPLHRQQVYRDDAHHGADTLEVTDWLAERVLAVPLYSHMPESDVHQVGAIIHRLHAHAEAVRAKLAEPVTAR